MTSGQGECDSRHPARGAGGAGHFLQGAGHGLWADAVRQCRYGLGQAGAPGTRVRAGAGWGTGALLSCPAHTRHANVARSYIPFWGSSSLNHTCTFIFSSAEHFHFPVQFFLFISVYKRAKYVHIRIMFPLISRKEEIKILTCKLRCHLLIALMSPASGGEMTPGTGSW